MVHFDAFWSTFYTNCNCHYDHDINSNIVKLHAHAQQSSKMVDPEIFVKTFLCEVKFGLKFGLRPKFGSDFRLIETFDLAEVDLTHGATWRM